MTIVRHFMLRSWSWTRRQRRRVSQLFDLPTRASPAQNIAVIGLLPAYRGNFGEATRQHGEIMEPDNRNGESHHILVVEDHPGVLNATLLLLRSAGYRVTTATSLTEAIERARDNSDLELIITDFHLGRGDTGKQVVSSVRQLRGPNFKAIVITGDTASAVHRFDGDDALCWMPWQPEGDTPWQSSLSRCDASSFMDLARDWDRAQCTLENAEFPTHRRKPAANQRQDGSTRDTLLIDHPAPFSGTQPSVLRRAARSAFLLE